MSSSLIHDFLEPNQSFDSQKNKQEKQNSSYKPQDIKIQDSQKVVNNEKKYNDNIVNNSSNHNSDGRISNFNIIQKKNIIPENSFKSMSNLLYPNNVPQPLQQSSLTVLSKLTNIEISSDKEKSVQGSQIRSSLLIPTAPQNQNLNNIVQNLFQQESSLKLVNKGQRLQKLIETPEIENQMLQSEVINPKQQKLNNENQSLLSQLKEELESYKKDLHREKLTDSEDDSDDEEDELDSSNNLEKRKQKEGNSKIFEIHKELELYKGLDIKTVQNLKKQEEQKLYDKIFNEVKLTEYQQQYFLSFNDIIKNIQIIDKNLFRYKLKFSPCVSQKTQQQPNNNVQIQQNEIPNPIQSENACQLQKENIQEQIQPEIISKAQQIPLITNLIHQEENQTIIFQTQEQESSVYQKSSLVYEKERCSQIKQNEALQFKEKEQILLPLIQQEKTIQNLETTQIQGQTPQLIQQENESNQILNNTPTLFQEKQVSQIQQKESSQIEIEQPQISQREQSPLISKKESAQIQETEQAQIQETKSALIQETESAQIQETESAQIKVTGSPLKCKISYYSDDLSNSLSVRSYKRKQSEDELSRNFQTDESEQQILVEDDLDEEQKKILFQNDIQNQKDSINSSENNYENEKPKNKEFESDKGENSQELQIQICLEGLSNNKPQQTSQEIKINKNVFGYDSLSSSISIDDAQKIMNSSLNQQQKQDLEMNLVQTKNLNPIELKQNTPSKDSRRKDSYLSDSLNDKEKSSDNLSNKTSESSKSLSAHNNKKQENSSTNQRSSDSDKDYNKKQKTNKKKGEEKSKKKQKRSNNNSRKRSSSSSRSRSSSSSSSRSSSGSGRNRNRSSFSQKNKNNKNSKINRYTRNHQNTKYTPKSSSKSQSSSSSSNQSRSSSSSSSSSERRYKKKKFNKPRYSQSRSSSIDQRKSNISSRSSVSKEDDFFKKQAISSQSSIDHSDQRILNKVNFKLQNSQADSDDQSIKKDNKQVENIQNKSLDQLTKALQPEQQKQQIQIPQNQSSLIKEQSKEPLVKSTQNNLPVANESAPKPLNPQITGIQPQPKLINQDPLIKTSSFESKSFIPSQVPQSVVTWSLFEPVGNIQASQQIVPNLPSSLTPINLAPQPLLFNKNSGPQTNLQNTPQIINNQNNESQNKEVPAQVKITNPVIQPSSINAPQAKSSIPAPLPISNNSQNLQNATQQTNNSNNQSQNKEMPAQVKISNPVIQTSNIIAPQAKSSISAPLSTSNNSQPQTKKQNIQQDKKIKTVKPENPFGCRTIYESDEDSSSDSTDSNMDEELNPKQQNSQQIQQQTPAKNTQQQNTNKISSVNALQKQDYVNLSQQNTDINSSMNILKKQDSLNKSISTLQRQDPVNSSQQNTDKSFIANGQQQQDLVKSQSIEVALKKQTSNQDSQPTNIKNTQEDQPLNQKQNSIKKNQEEQSINQKQNNICQIPQPLSQIQIAPQVILQNIENIKDPRIKKKFEQQEKKNQVFDSKLNSLKNNVILFPNIGSLNFDDPERIISHLYHNGQLFFKVSWKPRLDKIQMPPTFIEYFKFKQMYPVICDKYLIPILSSQLIKY
ncbi:hypothetical protein ABPG74_001043 [Tetrahymena malaccensis]